MTNKLIIWDLDGVLIESRELHYESLNAALHNVDSKYIITREEHLSTYDGLSTTKKLDMLTEQKGLPKKLHNKIWKDKQIATFDLIKRFPVDGRAVDTFREIKNRGWKIAVCSNSIRETLKLALLSIGVMEFVDVFVSNEDVSRTKPYPEMYWKAMTLNNALPKNTIIVEDSHIGRQGATDSGANLYPVENSNDWTKADILKEIDKMENKTHKSIPWRDKKLNVLIPMAGAGSRFADAGYTFPKPLIEVRGKPMIQVVVENLNIEANYIFVVQKAHYEKYDLEHVLNNIAPGCKIIQTDGLTQGAACTALLAKEYINSDSPLFFANSDQFVEWNSNEVLYAFNADGIDGGIVTFEACFGYRTLVDTKEYGKISIGKIVTQKLPCSVKSFNTNTKQVEYSKVTGFTRLDGRLFDWTTVKNPFNNNYNFKVTTNHRFLTDKNEWETIEDISKKNTKIKTIKKKLTKTQYEVFNGTMLGDGSISISRGKVNSGLKFSHSIKQKEWAMQKLSVFGNSSIKYYKTNVKGKEYDYVSGSTSVFPEIKYERSRWYANNKKIVPEDLKLTFMTAAVWYMDDGTLINKNSKTPTARFSTDGFDLDSINILKKSFEDLNISTYITKSNNKYRLVISSNSADVFFNGISPYVIPEMRYKLPQKYLDIPFDSKLWENEENEVEYFDTNILVGETFDGQVNSDTKYAFCISTENENFIVNDFIAHNCHPKWSYAKVGADGFVSEVAEKKVISNDATVGFYWWKNGSDFVKYAEQMINEDVRINGEFYTAPVFNWAISAGKKVRVKKTDGMWGIGTPSDLEYFLSNYKGKL